ncbi:putative biosynthetic protein (TIGR04098 family) [Stackebrandtia endophytica]|uniref:Putative biosynthetic protein (TIGR04098 family) n=1 Tax=Stackebrandtia endophytica TaxID=1496996 RepID=A0A543ARU3_9ACTN|nr:LnmK family bifunctional acyltransferase/decarboxylase [Stackebrandtia endophytica]TQL75310.1 putative biosynthetic protein (TIGR04098 family) [Stackebrandtia endophytica]
MTTVTKTGDSTVERHDVVRPGMCGHNSLLLGQIGDWTWEAVSRVCDTDVLRAEDATGRPTYLSFYYYRVRGGRLFQPRTPGFGDHLQTSSRVFDFGSESVLTLHRIRRFTRPPSSPPPPFDVDEFYAGTDLDCLYVENFNRWIGRGGQAGNADLVTASPKGFHHRHLPALPDRYSPRRCFHRARTTGTFRADPAELVDVDETTVTYRVDPTRDLNGVGLLYFAAYFSIVDWALLRWWRSRGRSDDAFMRRVVTDQQLCYLGNADAGCEITIRLRVRRHPAETAEIVDLTLHEGDRPLAVCTLHLSDEEMP